MSDPVDTPPSTPPAPSTDPMRKVRRAARPRAQGAIPRVQPLCTVCKHPAADQMLEEKMRGVPHVQLAQKFFPNENQRTVANKLTKHFSDHINVSQSMTLLPVVLPAHGSAPLAVSTERIFNRESKKRINAQQTIETLMCSFMERFNLLEDEFMATHLHGKCEACGRSPDQNANLGKLLTVGKSILEANSEWLKIKNPKEVIKFFFNSTFLRFVENMMAHYVNNLQEKARSIRQAVNEFSEGKISHQLLLRRVAEVEDLGTHTIAEKGIMEMRQIQAYIDKEFGKSGWGMGGS